MLFYLGGSLLILLVLVAAIWTVCSKRYASRFNVIFLLAAAAVLVAFVLVGHSQWNRQWQLLRLLHTPAASSGTGLANEEKALLRQMDALPLRMGAIRSEHKQDGARYHQIIRHEGQTYVVTLEADASPFFWAPTYTIRSVSQAVDTAGIEAGTAFDIIFTNGLYDVLGKYNHSGSSSYEPEQMRFFFAVDVDMPPTQEEAAEIINAVWAEIAGLAQCDDANTLLKPYRIEFGFRTGQDDTLYTPGHKDWNSTSIMWDRAPKQP